jgi:hypothetical protein
LELPWVSQGFQIRVFEKEPRHIEDPKGDVAELLFWLMHSSSENDMHNPQMPVLGVS